MDFRVFEVLTAAAEYFAIFQNFATRSQSARNNLQGCATMDTEGENQNRTKGEKTSASVRSVEQTTKEVCLQMWHPPDTRPKHGGQYSETLQSVLRAVGQVSNTFINITHS